jgi:dihydrofolate synthase/folylpolyglutamate synthase
MTYQETLDYLYTTLPMFSRIGAAAFKKDLTNTLEICEALGNPQKKFKSIHVAGTNGKGSVSHMLAAVLQTANYKTGLYTSPHLKDFRERIKVNGEMCDEDFIVTFVEKVKPLIEKIQPSFFEITVAMAFSYFAEQNVDVAVVEVGLGGRLDSTNIITPELCVITNIGFDHMNMLGDTLEKIAYEKAGIIKGNIPVIIGETFPETKPVFEKVAKEKNAPLIFAGNNRYAADWNHNHNQLNVTVVEKEKDEHITYRLDLPGIYQRKNLVTVLETIKCLQKKGWKIEDEQIHKGLSQAKKITGLHGRWEVIHQKPTVVLDVAHNVDGIKQLVEQIELSTYNDLHIIIGMVKDKEIEKILEQLPKFAKYYFTKAQIPRALPTTELALKAARLELKGNIYNDVDTALKEALQHANEEDLIIVCGSVFLVGELTIND